MNFDFPFVKYEPDETDGTADLIVHYKECRSIVKTLIFGMVPFNVQPATFKGVNEYTITIPLDKVPLLLNL